MRQIIFFQLLFYCFIVFAQTDTLQLNKKIDSLKQIDYQNYSFQDYILYSNILRHSKKINHPKGIMKSYIGILDYHTKHANIDSLLYYSNQFEKYYEDHPNKKLLFEYSYKLGYNLLYKFNLPEYALPYYVDSWRLLDNNDVKTKFKLINGITHCYIYKGQYDLIIKQIKEVLKDTNHIPVRSKNIMKITMALAYQLQEKPEKSKPLLESVLKESLDNQDSLHYTYAKVYQGYNLYLEKDYHKSIEILIDNFDLLQKYFPKGVVNHYEFLSLSYAKLKRFKKAASTLRKATTNSPVSELPKLYDHLANYYIKLGKKDSALIYNARKSKIVDSIRNLEKRIYSDFYQTKINFVNTTRENEKIKLKQVILSQQNEKQKSYIIILIIGIICLMSGSGAFIFYKKNDKSKKENDILKQNEKTIMRDYIKLRENELSAILINEQNKLKDLKEIRNQFYAVMDKNNSERFKKPITSFNRFLKNNLSNEVFTKRMESRNLGLIIQLKENHPTLTKTNIRHCLLVKSGFTIKESANLLNITPDTVKTARYRAKSKMGLSNEVSLKKFLDETLVFNLDQNEAM